MSSFCCLFLCCGFTSVILLTPMSLMEGFCFAFGFVDLMDGFDFDLGSKFPRLLVCGRTLDPWTWRRLYVRVWLIVVNSNKRSKPRRFEKVGVAVCEICGFLRARSFFPYPSSSSLLLPSAVMSQCWWRPRLRCLWSSRDDVGGNSCVYLTADRGWHCATIRPLLTRHRPESRQTAICFR